MKNPKVEMCFFGKGTQVRVTGALEEVNDEKLKAEIFAHPSRKFLQQWKEQGVDELLRIFRMKEATAVTWTMKTNFNQKQPIKLY